MRPIDADALNMNFADISYANEGLRDDFCEFLDCVMVEVDNAPTIMEIGNCEGCWYKGRKRPQKCSCCRRNPDMKDCYEVIR